MYAIATAENTCDICSDSGVCLKTVYSQDEQGRDTDYEVEGECECVKEQGEFIDSFSDR